MFGSKYKNYVPSRVRRKYSEGELKIFDNIEIDKPKTGWGMIRYFVIISVILCAFGYCGFMLSQYSKSYFGWGGEHTISDASSESEEEKRIEMKKGSESLQ